MAIIHSPRSQTVCTTLATKYTLKLHNALTNLICSVTFGAQTPTSELHATDTTDGSIRIDGQAKNIHATRTNSGGCPPSNTTNEAEYKVNVEVTGLDTDDETTDIGISH